MRYVYSIFLYLLLPFVLLRLFFKGLKNPSYLRRWGERLGFVDALVTKAPVIWIHAVSYGEVQACIPLVERLKKVYPDTYLLVTTTTPTGSDRVLQALGPEVGHCYLPFDLPDAMGRFFARIKPSLCIIMETELWPNLSYQCHQQGVPLILANLRLSARSFKSYLWIKPLIRQLLGHVSAIAAQGDSDARRIIELGADPSKVEVTGTVKFDVYVSASLKEEAAAVRRRFGTDRSIWIAASTHEGEEKIILKAFSLIKKQEKSALLILVPRHPERFKQVEALVRRKGWHYDLRSQTNTKLTGLEVYIGDTMGELPLLYAISDVAFVGGSLVPIGGHNPLEPAAIGMPIIFGPHVFNFAVICSRLESIGVAKKVDGKGQLADAVLGYLQRPNERHNAGEAASRFVSANRGAREKVINIIQQLWPPETAAQQLYQENKSV